MHLCFFGDSNKDMGAVKIVAIAVLSLLSGVICFVLTTYDITTLVVRAKTLEEGTKTIRVSDSNGSITQRDITIGSDGGDPSMYVVEMPRSAIRSVTIPPLAAPGKFEIISIALLTEDRSYQWDTSLACVQRLKKGHVFRNEPCERGAPEVSLGNDGTIAIAADPAFGHAASLLSRVTMACVAVLVVFISFWYLFVPFRGNFNSGSWREISVRACWLVVVGLFLYQLLMLCRYSVDLPYWEEWEFFDVMALPSGISWKWLSAQVCHQRMMIFTKAMAWINFELFALNFRILKVMNYVVFGGIVFGIARLKTRIIGSDNFSYFPVFLVFLMSPLVYEVHAASFQSGETFALLCSVIMLHHVIQEEPKYKAAIIFSIFAILGMCSLSAGFVYALVFLAIGSGFTIRAMFREGMKGKRLWYMLVLWGILIPFLFFWLHGLKKPDPIWAVPPWLLPGEGKFWTTYFELLGFSFGFESEASFAGILCLFAVLAPLIILLKNKESRWEPQTWQVASAILGSLAVVGLIVVGRGNMPYSIKVSRYAVFGYVLIPYAAIAWWLALKEKRALLLFLLFCLGSYVSNWDYGIYRDIRQLELSNLDCVQQYVAKGGDGMCPGTHMMPIGKFFDNAKGLNASFTRQFDIPLRP